MAVLHGAVEARPAIVSALAALAIHAAVVSGLPRARAARVLDLLPRPVEVDFAEPPVVPPPEAPAAVAEATPRPAVARAVPVTRNAPVEKSDKANPDDTILAGDGDAPFADTGPRPPSGPGTGTAMLPAAPPPPPPPPPSPPPPAVDRSRAPALADGGRQWSCPWPNEADHLDDAVVVLSVVVDAAGHATKVDVLTDPGNGFGREARRCALRAVYAPGLDRDGLGIASRTKPIRVRFSR